MDFFTAFLIALGTGAASGLITWGGVRVELRYLRRDIDLAHARLDVIDGRCIAEIRAARSLRGAHP